VLGRLEASAGQYALAVEQSPRDPSTRVLYAQVLAGLGRADEALAQVDAALAVSPEMPPALELRALLAAPATGETPHPVPQR
jgi:hypothetical protein